MNVGLAALAVLGTVLFIRTGIDERARAFFLEHVPLGTTTERFLHLQLGMLWPLVPALWTFRKGFYGRDRRRIAAACATLQAIIVTAVITMTIKMLTGRPLPHVPENAADEFHFFELATNRQFVRLMWPSGHTSEAFAAAAAMSVYYRVRWITVATHLIAVLVGFEMLAFNFHWTSDVLAGACLGHGLGRIIGNEFHEWASREEPPREALPPVA